MSTANYGWAAGGVTWRRNAPFSTRTGAMRGHVSRTLAAAIGRGRRSMGSEPFGGRKARLRGVVFDMDGTLTVPAIDFGAMYREVLGDETYAAMRARDPQGCIDILHHVETLAAPAQKRAHEIIARFENQALEQLKIMPGEFLEFFRICLKLCMGSISDDLDSNFGGSVVLSSDV